MEPVSQAPAPSRLYQQTRAEIHFFASRSPAPIIFSGRDRDGLSPSVSAELLGRFGLGNCASWRSYCRSPFAEIRPLRAG